VWNIKVEGEEVEFIVGKDGVTDVATDDVELSIDFISSSLSIPVDVDNIASGGM